MPECSTPGTGAGRARLLAGGSQRTNNTRAGVAQPGFCPAAAQYARYPCHHLETEFASAVDRVRQPHLDRLRSLGVAPATVAAIGERHPSFGILTATAGANGLYEPGEGPLFVAQPVYEAGLLVDLVAWRSTRPDRWWLRTGLGWLLNGDACLYGGWDGHELTLAGTPLDWLRSGARGAVVLDWESPELYQLRGFETIHCSDRGLAATLGHALLRSQRMPDIRVLEVGHAA